MIVFRQAARPTDRTPHVLADSVVEPEYPVCLWVVDPEIGAPTVQVIQITEFEGKTLVAVPFAVWHRGVSKRVLPGTALVKPTRRTDDRSEVVEDVTVKLWVGFLRHEYVQQLELVEEADYEFYFEHGDNLQLPFWLRGLWIWPKSISRSFQLEMWMASS